MSRLVLFLFLFIKIIFVSSEGNSSLVFVIDDTRSMKYEINQVRKEVDSIMDIVLDEKSSQIKDIVLVTFNDPEARLRRRTNSRNVIKSAWRSIKVGNYDNHDCPEASLEGLKLALENSSPNSYVYVFTDASAHNAETYDSIERICQQSQSQITFVLTGDCGSIHTPGYRVYNKIATITGGQVYRVDKDELDQVLNTLKEMIKGKKAAIISQNLAKSGEYVEIPFTIDDKTEYAIISASGKNVVLKLRGPQLRTKKLMWTRNSKVVKIVDPVPGDYVVKVKGTETPNIVVYGRTDFVFTPGFSEFLPKYFDDTAKQPVAGTENHLSIQVEDPDYEVIIESAQILDMAGNVIRRMPLIKKEDFYYTHNIFRSPDTLFHVAVLGKVETTGGSIKRITSVPIQPQIPPPSVPDTAPTVSIKEGAEIRSNYSDDVVLTCDVVGKPNPTIIWKDSKGHNQQSENFLRLVPNVFVSYLRLYKVNEPETYECIASNILGTRKASIHVDVTPPFSVNYYPLVSPAIDKTVKTVTVKEGEAVSLDCRVTRGIPKASITWLQQDPSSPESYETEFIEVDIPTVEVNDNILNIDYAEIGLSGKYKCVAENSVGADEHIIELIVKARPEVNIDKNSVTLDYGTADKVICNVIANPRPQIEWKDDMGNVIVDSSDQEETGMFHIEYALEMIVVSRVGVQNFYCYAKNDQGVGFGKLRVKTISPLQIGKEPEEAISLDYGKQATLYCNITADYPLLIKWYKINKETNRKELLNDPDKFALLADRSELRIHYMDMDLIGQYACEAELLYDREVKGTYKMNVTIMDKVCIINRKKDTKPNSPLVLTRSCEEESILVWLDLESAGDIIIIEAEDTVTFLCPSSDESNKFSRFPEVNEIDAICDRDDIFKINDTYYHLSELDCKETLKPVIVRTGERCLNNDTEWLLIGFKAEVFLDVYKVCYDTLNGMPIITSNLMFKRNNTGPHIHQDWYIDERFEMGNEAYTCNKDTTSCCYAKKQLVNALDVAYGPSQISTYIDHVNSVPIWQPCPNSRRVTWAQVEQVVREQLEMENVLTVWSGESHFDEDELGGMVPRYLWKIVLVNETHIVAVVYVNDQHPDMGDILCKNTCEDRMISNMPCNDKYTYTCEFKDFLRGFNLNQENFEFC